MTVRPDFAVGSGTFSAGTTGKFLVAREHRLPRGVLTTLHGFMALDAPGDARRDTDLGVRRGLLLWTMQGGGRRCEAGFAVDPGSRAVHGSLQAPLPGALSLNAFGVSRWTHAAWGDEHVDHANLSVRRALGHGVVVQPGAYVFDVQARDDVRWYGRNLRVEVRGAEFFVNDEGARGRRGFARRTWRAGQARFTLGGQLAQHPVVHDRGLLELGIAHGRLGVDVFPGTGQRAVLLHAGGLQLGIGTRDAWRDIVLGVRGFSLSLATPPSGPSRFGFGFVWRGVSRTVMRSQDGLAWQPPIPQAALDDPRVRWPRLATL